MNIYVITAIFCLLLTSCNVSKGLYYWGNYEKTYYNKVHSPGDNATEEHMVEIKKIIDKTERKSGLNIGPGIYAEYGYYLLQSGNEETSKSYFSKEKESFPESSKAINFISK